MINFAVSKEQAKTLSFDIENILVILFFGLLTQFFKHARQLY